MFRLIPVAVVVLALVLTPAAARAQDKDCGALGWLLGCDTTSQGDLANIEAQVQLGQQDTQRQIEALRSQTEQQLSAQALQAQQQQAQSSAAMAALVAQQANQLDLARMAIANSQHTNDQAMKYAYAMAEANSAEQKRQHERVVMLTIFGGTSLLAMVILGGIWIVGHRKPAQPAQPVRVQQVAIGVRDETGGAMVRWRRDGVGYERYMERQEVNRLLELM